MSEQKTRDCAEFTDAHRTHRNVDLQIHHESEKSSELGGFVSANCDFENVGVVGFGQCCFGTQAARRRCGLEVMERKNSADILFSGAGEQRLELTCRTQLNVEIFGVRQKAREQIAPLFERKIIGAAFSRVASSDDEWGDLATASASFREHDRHFVFELVDQVVKKIESKLKEVRWVGHADGETQVCARSDHADNLWAGFFDRSARCHILSDSKDRVKAMMGLL